MYIQSSPTLNVSHAFINSFNAKNPIRTGNAVLESKPAEMKRNLGPLETMVVENLKDAMDICGNKLA